jgi:glycosyltransferase involved in cell wall biosynthesis
VQERGVKRLLLISYNFPPIGGAGTQRPMGFAHHLAAYGWDVTVLTGPGTARGYWTPQDDDLMRQTPDVTVLRVPGPEPQQTAGWAGRLERWLRLPTAWERWWWEGVEAIAADLRDVDVIYTVMPPFESTEASMRLSRRLGVPWIPDLGDPWALDEMMIYPTALHRRSEMKRMRRGLESAAAIVMSTDEAAARIPRAFPELAAKPILTIPNGFDAADFEKTAPVTDGESFRIVHTGYLHTDLGRRQRRRRVFRAILGGQTRGLDILTRSHVFLLQAVQRAIDNDPRLANRVEVHLAGVMNDVDREVAGTCDAVRIHGFLNHDESVSLVRSADLLFLPLQNLPSPARTGNVPGKTYEYLASGRPILAAAPAGDARDIVLRAGGAYACDPDDVGSMASVIGGLAERALTPSARDSEFVSRFEYQRLSGTVATLLNDVVLEKQSASVLESSVGAAHSTRRVVTANADGHESPHRVLHLAYHFPPIGGAGTQRTLKFVRYLPEYGWDSTVVTGPGSLGGRWTPRDESLGWEVPPDVDVFRLAGPEPGARSGWRQRSERWLFMRSQWTRWWVEGAVAAGSALGPDMDIIYASMSPYVSAEAAARLSERLGKPWVAGLRDTWALDEMMIPPTVLHRRHELSQMRRALASAAAIVVTASEAAVLIRQTFPELERIPIATIPNGFDAADFDGPCAERTDGAFRIVHTGYLHTDLGREQHRAVTLRHLLGGHIREVDVLTRSHIFLLQAIDRLPADIRGHVEVHLAGVLSEEDRAVTSDVVRLHGYLPHAESVRLIRSADLLFLPMQNLPMGTRASIVPGKTYEYLATGLPILAGVPDGDARDILAAAGTARICRPDDVAGMSAAIAAEVERWRNGAPTPTLRLDAVQQYERRRLAGNLAEAFEEVIDDGASPRRTVGTLAGTR